MPNKKNRGANTNRMDPKNQKRSEGGVDRKSALNAPTISRAALLRIKMRIRVAIPNRSKARDSPIRTSVGNRLLSLKLNQSAGNKSNSAPDNATTRPAQ